MGLASFINHHLGLRGLGIVVEVSNTCNARCVWCWMYNSGRKAMGFMKRTDFEHLIDINLDLLPRISLVPYHRGEPLIHPNFYEMMEYASGHGAKLGELHTNLSCQVDTERLLSLPIPSYVVNIGGVTKEIHEAVMRRTSWELVTRNLRRLYEANGSHGKKLRVKMNPTRANVHQIQLLPEFVVSMGGEPEDAVVGTTGFTLPSLAAEDETRDFIATIVSKEVEPHLRFTCHEGPRGYVVRAKHGRPPCRFLMPTVKFDGRVTICCHDQLDMLDLGNAFDRPLRRILRSPRYLVALLRGVLKAHSFCRDCN